MISPWPLPTISTGILIHPFILIRNELMLSFPICAAVTMYCHPSTSIVNPVPLCFSIRTWNSRWRMLVVKLPCVMGHPIFFRRFPIIRFCGLCGAREQHHTDQYAVAYRSSPEALRVFCPFAGLPSYFMFLWFTRTSVLRIVTPGCPPFRILEFEDPLFCSGACATPVLGLVPGPVPPR